MTDDEETRVREDIKHKNFDCQSAEIPKNIQEAAAMVATWIRQAQIGDTLVIPDIYKRYKHSIEILFIIHTNLREQFSGMTFLFLAHCSRQWGT